MGLELFSPDDDSARRDRRSAHPTASTPASCLLLLRDRHGVTLAPARDR
jgi:hypothetical protein